MPFSTFSSIDIKSKTSINKGWNINKKQGLMPVSLLLI